jgi:enoyl-CoA hydratase
MILTGEVIDAQEAYRIGLVNKIVPPNELMTVAMDMAQEMASKGPIALSKRSDLQRNGFNFRTGTTSGSRSVLFTPYDLGSHRRQ